MKKTIMRGWFSIVPIHMSFSIHCTFNNSGYVGFTRIKLQESLSSCARGVLGWIQLVFINVWPLNIIVTFLFFLQVRVRFDLKMKKQRAPLIHQVDLNFVFEHKLITKLHK